MGIVPCAPPRFILASLPMYTSRALLASLSLCVAPTGAALLRPTAARYPPFVASYRIPSLGMSTEQRATANVDVDSAACEMRQRLRLDLVHSFLAATERGDAAAAMNLCHHDFLFKTHRATTDSLAAAKERLGT